jgi:hypothetical protein
MAAAGAPFPCRWNGGAMGKTMGVVRQQFGSAKGTLVRIFPLFLVVFMGLASVAMAAPLVGASFLPLPPGHSAIAIAGDNLPNSGEVSETFPAGNYTYLHVVGDGEDEGEDTGTWLAIPRQEIAVGSQVRYGQGSLMKSFYSSSLDRTFDEVFFLGSVEVVSVSSVSGVPDHPPVPTGHDNLSYSGEVSETIAAGSYTYLHVEHDGIETWLAIPRQEIAVGAQVHYGEGSLMTAFYSKSLDRTFDEVFFLGGVVVVDE